MAIDSAAPRTRRAMLAAALGAGAATVASALGRPLPARAGVDGDVVLGATNSAATVTVVNTPTSSGTAFQAASVGIFGNGTGVKGVAGQGNGVHGIANQGNGVLAESANGYAVFATSVSGTGVRASSQTAQGLLGMTISGTGVQGLAEDTTGHNTGVLGETQSNQGIGVSGVAYHGEGGIGVRGEAMAEFVNSTGVLGVTHGLFGRGVFGEAQAGIGVYGQSRSGTAGHFAATIAAGGTALRAVGRVRFDKCVGVATIASGTSGVVVTPGIDLSGSSAVVATLQGSSGDPWNTVSRCVVNASTNTFRIYLSANCTQNVKVAWHVFG